MSGAMKSIAGRRRAPHVDEVRQRAGARVLPGLRAGADQRGVGEHRQGVLGLARGGHRAACTAAKCHAMKISSAAAPFTEDLAPRARRASRRPPATPPAARARASRCPSSRAVISSAGTAPRKRRVRLRAVVARVRDHPDLVLHLHHQQRVLGRRRPARTCFISAANARASASRFAAENGDRISCGRPVASTVRGNRLCVALHPRRGVARHAVLPGAEPQEDQAHVVRPGVPQQSVDAGEVERALRGFDDVPVDRARAPC